MVDRNSHRAGEEISSLATIFAAVDAMPGSETYDFMSLDVISDRNSLRQLLRWASKQADKDFRIDLE